MEDVKIGDLTLTVYSAIPNDWSMENDYVREIQKLDEHLYRVTSWTGRVMYLIEDCGKTIRLSFQQAIRVSSLITEEHKRDREHAGYEPEEKRSPSAFFQWLRFSLDRADYELACSKEAHNHYGEQPGRWWYGWFWLKAFIGTTLKRTYWR